MLNKRKLVKICSILLAAAVITGCGGTAADKDSNNSSNNKKQEVTEKDVKDNEEAFEFKNAGLVVNIPKEYQDKGIEAEDAGTDDKGHIIIGIKWYYKPVTEQLLKDMEKTPKEDYTEEMLQDLWGKMDIHSKYLMEIALVEEKEYVGVKADKDNPGIIDGWDSAEELAVNNGYMYLANIPKNSTEGMDTEEKELYEECQAYMETLKKNLEFTEISDSTGSGDKVPSFTTKDLKGNTVTESIFAEKDLTVINIWGTFCSPCIGEMPELAEWDKEMPDNVQLIGLVCDIEGESDSTHKDLATTIMEKAGADFTNIIPDSSLRSLLENVTGVPTTMFVDKNGNITGEPVVGADVDAYKKFVEDYIGGK